MKNSEAHRTRAKGATHPPASLRRRRNRMEKATGRNRAGHLPVFLEVLGCHQRNLRVLISGFLFKKKFFFFFKFLAVLGLHCGTMQALLSLQRVGASHCSGFSCCGARALACSSVVATSELWSMHLFFKVSLIKGKC